MSFTIVWRPIAETQLAEIWLAATDRAAVTAAANEIETALRSSPESVGESRDERTRVAVVPPIAVHFEVRDADRLVLVLTVHSIPPSLRGRP